jgi:hypothetical protein
MRSTGLSTPDGPSMRRTPGVTRSGRATFASYYQVRTRWRARCQVDADVRRRYILEIISARLDSYSPAVIKPASYISFRALSR